MSRIPNPDLDDPSEPLGPPYHANPYGPPIPETAWDGPPFLLDRVEELAQPNHAGETMLMIDGRVCCHNGDWSAIKLILACSPHSGSIQRAAMHSVAGAGYVAIDPTQLPGNLLDIVASIVLDPREAK